MMSKKPGTLLYRWAFPWVIGGLLTAGGVGCASGSSSNDEQTDVQEDPAHRDYDPIRLQQATNSSMKDIWQREPRDRQWAEVRSSFIREQLASALGNMKHAPILTGVDCRTSTCRVAITVAAEQIDSFMSARSPGRTLSRVSGLQLSQDAVEDRANIEFYLLFSKRMRDHDEYREWYENQ